MASSKTSFGKRAGPPKPASGGKAAKQRRRRWLKFGATAFGMVALGGAIATAWIWHWLYHDLPDLPASQEMWTLGRDASIEFKTLDGRQLDVRGPIYGEAVRIEALPPHVAQAFIAAEDKRFYEHEGADTAAIIRAAWSNWRSGRTVSGASTITQQLVKNLVLSPEQTLKRKAQEMRLARQLEQRLTKDEILELYLNRTYFGSGAYGLGAAAEHYFGVEAGELTLPQAAVLAGLPQAPSRLALDQNPDAAKQRQAYVLGEMVEAGYLTESQAAAAAAAPVDLIAHPPLDPQLGYVFDAAVEEIKAVLQDPPPDLVVTLTIDPDLQRAVQTHIAETLAEEGEALRVSQAAALLMRSNGHVIAMVGGVDYNESKFNRAIQARRQPGSAFKSVVYAAALEAGLDPHDVRLDAPIRIGKWQPKNYARGHLGPMTISEAYARSINTVAAALTQEIGENQVINMARRLGIRSPMEPLPSIALGSQEVTLWEITRAYATFMTGGRRIDPYLVAAIHDSRGELLFERPEPAGRRALDGDTTADMTAMMVRVIEEGTGMRARVEGWQVAGKTGTSQDWRDAWFVGYTASLTGGVWVGNDDNSPMAEVTGGELPADLFAAIMLLALENERPATLAGAERYVAVSEEAEERIAFYRALSGAFTGVAGVEVASLDTAQ